MEYSGGFGCAYCEVDIFLKAKVLTKPILAPLTHKQELIDKLIEMTGETYVLLQKRFCPMCGARIKEGRN